MEKAFISTLGGDLPILIEQGDDNGFVFFADIDIPTGIRLFFKDSKAVNSERIKLPSIIILEKAKVDKGYRYQAIMHQRCFDFNQWEKLHRRK